MRDKIVKVPEPNRRDVFINWKWQDSRTIPHERSKTPSREVKTQQVVENYNPQNKGRGVWTDRMPA